MSRTVIISSSSFKYMLSFKSFESDVNRNLPNFGPDLSLFKKSVH